jgi:hypothetical protein
MPYKIVKKTGSRPYKIVNKNTRKVVGSSITKTMAKKALRARYAHTRDV